MRRGALLDEIQRLERALLGDESGARSEAETRAAKLDAAIDRLDTVALSLEKQLIAIDGVGEFSASDEVLFAEERKTLSARIERLRSKIEKLHVSRPLVEVSKTLGRPKGLASELRTRLATLVKQLREDPHVSRADVRPFQLRLVELVRERRRTLDETSERLHDARDYLLHCAGRLEGLIESAAAMTEVAEAAGDSGSMPGPAASTKADDPDLFELFVEGAPATPDAAANGHETAASDVPQGRGPSGANGSSPRYGRTTFAGDRAALATRVEMAHLAVDDAVAALRTLAHDWPELLSLANRPDWDKLPFAAIRAELSSSRLGPETPASTVAQHFRETKQLCEALALWVEELRTAVASAPPPISP